MGLLWTEERLRLFVACELPPATAVAVDEWQREVLAVHPTLRLASSLHVTLCFLGDVRAERAPAIVDALSGLRWEPIATGFGAPLFLPERGAKRVVALQLDDPHGALSALQSDAAAALVEMGVYRREKRPFLPHLTVARYRRPGQPFPLQNVNLPEFGVDRMVLYSSLLERAGAVHTPLAVFPAS